MSFPGFPEEITNAIRIPDQFFRHVLLSVDKLDELKLTLYLFWRLERMEGFFHYIRFNELLKDTQLVSAMTKDPNHASTSLRTALRKATKRGTLLEVDVEDEQDTIICLNSPKGRAVVDAIKRGEWRASQGTHPPIEIYAERPNIFQLYEANIGPLTPLIADALRDAERTYQADWVEEAFRIAVERNKRNWHYIDAILHRWQEGGRDDRKDQPDRRDTEEARRRYAKWGK